jgi:hypothetical protein
MLNHYLDLGLSTTTQSPRNFACIVRYLFYYSLSVKFGDPAMSFDIFISSFKDGGVRRRSYPRAVLKKAFGGLCDTSDPTRWKIRDSAGVVQLADKPKISGFGVNRPPGAEHPFWPALLDVLRETSSVLHWPGGGPVVTSESVVPSVPEDVIDALGEPHIVTSIQEIFRLIDAS